MRQAATRADTCCIDSETHLLIRTRPELMPKTILCHEIALQSLTPASAIARRARSVAQWRGLHFGQQVSGAMSQRPYYI